MEQDWFDKVPFGEQEWIDGAGIVIEGAGLFIGAGSGG